MRRIILATLLVMSLAACSDSSGGSEKAGGGSGKAGGFPSEIPLPNQTEFITSDADLYQFDVVMSLKEVRAFYEDRLDGWQVEDADDPTTSDLADTMGFSASFDGGTLVTGAVEPAGTTRLQFTLD